MCLAIPAQVVELRAGDNALVDGIAVGDYVIVHVGYALNKLDPEEAAKTLALFAEIGQFDAGQMVH